MCAMHIATSHPESTISDLLRSLTGNAKVTIEREAKIANIGTLDYRLRDEHGQEYFVEVKSRRITKLDVGQLATYATLLHKKIPSAKLVLIAKKVDSIHKEVLKEIGVEVIELEHNLSNSNQTLRIIPSKRINKKLELSPKEQESYFLLLRKGIVVVTPELLSKELMVPNGYSKNILSSLARKGMLSRFGRGKYVIISPDVVYGRKGYTIDPIVMLEQLVGDEPYYLAYTSALYIHGLSLQLPFETTVAVTKQKRSVKVGHNSIIKFVRIMAEAMFGYKQQRYLNSYTSVSDLEKTIIDCIDRHDLCGGISEVTRILSESLQQIDRDKLLNYLKKFNKQVVIQRLGFILEKLTQEGFEVDPKLLQNMENLKFRHVYRLDFTKPKSGTMSKKWKIIENADCMSWKN
ncbi:putative transcriptional regulator [Candidatus Nitrososphaera evergladensis SR1]|uniref:Putative transcriptional regulator n=1 Tax=Candidatus Nitrososphaera evergladensis SR1 TaxID=1459636 RepID=A0A075N1R3_9ARCH|nr:putative transcriptional regulator [Candidatus Nitrososphaera evergladensis SR1]